MNFKSSKSNPSGQRSSQTNRRECERNLKEIDDAYRLDPEQIMLRKFPHHKIGNSKFFMEFIFKHLKQKLDKNKRFARSRRTQRSVSHV